MMAALILTFTMGSIHAFSVLLTAIEQIYAASRAQAGLSYSIALVCLTATVLLGPRIYQLARPAQLAAAACLLASCGLIIAAFAPSLPLFWLGYGVIFGGANGIAYGFALLLAARAYPNRRGLAMGTATAAYALGAALFAPIFETLLINQSLQTCLITLAGTLIMAGAASFKLLSSSNLETSATTHINATLQNRHLAHLWLAYGLSVAAGLMAIGHAAGIMAAKLTNPDDAASTAFIGAIGIAVGNAIGGILAGALADRLKPNKLLASLTTIAAAAIAALIVTQNALAMLLALASIGFAYGAYIAAFPPVIANLAGIDRYPAIYGRIFTAWGTFGLLAPWLAGFTFDLTGNYQTALIIALTAALMATVLNLRLPAKLQ